MEKLHKDFENPIKYHNELDVFMDEGVIEEMSHK